MPEHEVVTVALDIKNHFDDTGHTPAKLDALILRYLQGLVWTPQDFLDTLTNPTKLGWGATVIRIGARLSRQSRTRGLEV